MRPAGCGELGTCLEGGVGREPLDLWSQLHDGREAEGLEWLEAAGHGLCALRNPERLLQDFALIGLACLQQENSW